MNIKGPIPPKVTVVEIRIAYSDEDVLPLTSDENEQCFKMAMLLNEDNRKSGMNESMLIGLARAARYKLLELGVITSTELMMK
jgi:hypothetical protein